MLALAAAAGCSDSFPPSPGPLDRFYFPAGLAVRRLPAGNTALLVVSTNFDLRFDFDVGGAVVAVDPDASGNALPPDQGGTGDTSLSVLGGVNIASFGGEIDYLAGAGPSWPNELPGRACPQLAGLLAAGAAKVVTASRGKQLVYPMDMSAAGGLACNGCGRAVRAEALDPYGVTAVCTQLGGTNKVSAYVTHLRAPGNEGWISEFSLLDGSRVDLDLGAGSTYTSTAYVTSALTAPASGLPALARLYVSTRFLSADLVPLRWFDMFAVVPGATVIPNSHNVASVVTGALTRKMAISSNGRRGYLMLDLFDYDLARTSGNYVPTGGALAVYDLTESAYGQPAMQLLRFVPTCVGSGELKVIPRSGQADLVALTCDTESALIFYDDQIGAVAARIGVDPATGRPRLGRQPFGLAMEARPAGTCTPLYTQARGPVACTRLYVGAFDSSWVSVVELDPTAPAGALMGKRLGRERD